MVKYLSLPHMYDAQSGRCAEEQNNTARARHKVVVSSSQSCCYDAVANNRQRAI